MKSGASDPLITKNRKEGGGFVMAGTIFSAQSLWYLRVDKWHHFWWWTVSEINWLWRQAGRANKQSIYLDVNCHMTDCLFGCFLLAESRVTVLDNGPAMRRKYWPTKIFFSLCLSYYKWWVVSIERSWLFPLLLLYRKSLTKYSLGYGPRYNAIRLLPTLADLIS